MKKLALSLLICSASVSAVADSKYSADILIGTSLQETNTLGVTLTDDAGVSVGLRFNYKVLDFLTVETGYTNYGTSSDFEDGIGIRTQIDAINLGLKGSYPLASDNFSVVGRIGAAKWDYRTSLSVPSIANEVNLSEDGTDLYYGLGFEYHATEDVSVGLEYTVTEFDVDVANVVDIEQEVANVAFVTSIKF